MSHLLRALPWAGRLVPGRENADNKRTRPYRPANTLAAISALRGLLSGAWRQLLAIRAAGSSARRLRLVEKIQLGDKQFVALMEIDGVSFLVSGGNGGAPTLIPAHEFGSGRKAQSSFELKISVAQQAAEAGSTTGNAVKSPASAGKRSPAAKETTTSKKTLDKQLPAPSEAKGAGGPGQGSSVGKRRRTAAINSPEPETVGRKAKLRSSPERDRTTVVAAAVLHSKTVKSVSAKPVRGKSSTLAAAPKIESVRDALQVEASVAGSKPVSPPAMDKLRTTQALPYTPVPHGADSPSREEEHARKEDEGTSLFPDFAAMLEIRMLASEVFEQVDAKKPLAPKTDANQAKSADRTLRQKSLVAERLHRVRRRLSGLACLLLIVLLPFGSARAELLPPVQVFSAGAHWSLSPQVGGVVEAIASRVSPATLALAAVRTNSQTGSNDIRISGLGGSSASWGIVTLLTLLTLLPSLLLCITPFARLLIVFHFLRQALGLQTTPSNQTLIGLSMILTFFLMQPVGEVIYRDAIVPAQAGKITPLDAVQRAGGPMRHFMAHYVREKDAELFLEIAKEPRPRSVDELSFRVLLPSYILSELKAGFQIGTVLFLPFLIVDMVVASITTSVGMMQLPPVVISTPLKLLLFLMVDGWHLLIGALMRSFN